MTSFKELNSQSEKMSDIFTYDINCSVQHPEHCKYMYIPTVYSGWHVFQCSHLIAMHTLTIGQSISIACIPSKSGAACTMHVIVPRRKRSVAVFILPLPGEIIKDIHTYERQCIRMHTVSSVFVRTIICTHHTMQ